MADQICTVPLPRLAGGGICGRPLSDQCVPCRLFDERAAEWHVIFNEYRSPPRVAVDGDI